MTGAPAWVASLCRIAREWKTGDLSIRARFTDARPDLDDPHGLDLVRQELLGDPSLVGSWQTYSWEKRGSPSPYLDGMEVGFYDGGRRDVVRYPDPLEACADFIWREARWVLAREH